MDKQHHEKLVDHQMRYIPKWAKQNRIRTIKRSSAIIIRHGKRRIELPPWYPFNNPIDMWAVIQTQLYTLAYGEMFGFPLWTAKQFAAGIHDRVEELRSKDWPGQDVMPIWDVTADIADFLGDEIAYEFMAVYKHWDYALK